MGLLKQARGLGRQDVDLPENRAEAVIAGEKAARTPWFVTVKDGSRCLDEAALGRARRLVGLKGA